MPDVFPTARFGFMDQDIDLERQTLSGGTTLTDETDRVATDGGGRVYAQFEGGELVDRETVLAWRALLGLLEEGVTPMVVPFCDPRHQPITGRHRVTYSDGTSHSDGTLFVGGGPQATAAADAALRATTLTITGEFPRPLIGGEWFAVNHSVKGWRAYKVRSIVGDEISFGPPLRQAVVAGEALDFSTPRCLMVQDGRASALLRARRHTTAAIRFVEA